jgi:hypothetical protein
MKRAVLLLLTTACFSTATLALEDTVIEMTDGKITGVKQVPAPPTDAFPSFAQTDVNGDGCVNRQEALNVGILTGTFNRFARRGCLNQAAYQAASEAPSH